ncbi:MAG: cell wall hydrolase [Lachnospiraceae bacterium]|nr:cell wall hydrolase [Lachnospiraceae bacterium]
MRKFKLKVLSLCVAGTLAFCEPSVLISNATEEQQINETNQKKAEAQQVVEDLEVDAQAAQAKVNSTAAQLNTLYSKIDNTNSQIAETENNIENLKAELAEAERLKNEQYSRLKSRIAFNYESNAGQNILTAFLEAGTFVNFLKRVDYMYSAAQYDQKIIEDYEQIAEDIEDKARLLSVSEDELKAIRSELSETQGQLNDLLGIAVANVNETNGQIYATQSMIDNYDAQISATQDQMEETDEKITELQNQMKDLEAAQAAAQAALAKRIAEEQEKARKEAAAQAAAEAKKKAEAEIRQRVEKEVRAAAEEKAKGKSEEEIRKQVTEEIRGKALEEAKKAAEQAAQEAFEKAAAEAEANGTEPPASPEPVGDVSIDEAAVNAQIEARVSEELKNNTGTPIDEAAIKAEIEARVEAELAGRNFDDENYAVYEDTSGAYAASESEIILLAATIQAEAGNQSYTGKLAVGSVIMNRVKSSKFPNTIYGVITQENQFEPWRKGIVTKFIEAGPNATCIEIARAVCNGSRNGNWLFFMTPKWADHYGITGYTKIGGHAFFYKWGAN